MNTSRITALLLMCAPVLAACGGGGDAGSGAITGPTTPAGKPAPSVLTNRIVFTSNRTGFELWSMQPDGSDVITLGLTGHTHDISPDGRQIAYTDAEQIHVANVNGTSVRLLTTRARNASPRWSPDGTKILFWSDRDGNKEVYVMNADGSAPTNLTNDAAEDLEATWSPDGTRIAFRSVRTGSGDIYVMKADGSEVTRLTTEAGQDANPRWSPDGTRIAFDGDRGRNFDVFVINADGSGLVNLTNHSALDSAPTWSPDGRMITFHSHRDGNSEVYVMNADGTGLRNITNAASNEGDAVWAK